MFTNDLTPTTLKKHFQIIFNSAKLHLHFATTLLKQFQNKKKLFTVGVLTTAIFVHNFILNINIFLILLSKITETKQNIMCHEIQNEQNEQNKSTLKQIPDEMKDEEWKKIIM